MDSKTEVKQECVSKLALEYERELFSKDFARKIKTDAGTVNNDCELETIMKIKVENSFPDLSTKNEEEAFPKEIVNKTFTDSADSKTDLRAGIKDATPISDFYSNCEKRNYSKDCVIKDHKIDSQIQIKEEVWWLERQSAPFVDNVTQDGTNEDFLSAESLRSSGEGYSGDSSDEPAVLPDQDIHLNDDPEFEKGRKWKSCVIKTASVVTPVCYEHIKCCDSGNVPSSLKQDNLVQQDNEICNKPYECDICGNIYSKPWSLKRHSMIHEGKMPFQCDICGKNFRDLWNLNRHSFIHEGQKPHKCGVCKKEFAVRSSLKRHYLIHEGKKPHKCNICKKAFIDFSHLKRHNYLIHETKSVHKCEICEKTFTYLSNLKTHSLIHEDERPFKCNICDKSFAHLLGLKTHNHKIHGRKKDKLT